MVVSGNVTGSNLLTAGLISSTGTITGSSHLGVVVSVSGNVTAGYFVGNGATLSSITGANVSGTVANATYAVSSGTVVANAQGNITSVGVLTNLSVTGNTQSGNLLTAGQISSTGNITTAGYFVGTFIGNVSGNLTVPGSNTQVIYNNDGNAGASAGFTFDSAANALVVTGNITGSRIIGNGALLSSITGSNVSGTVANATYAVSSGTTATITANAQPNITSVGTLSSLTVTANVTGGNILTGGIVSATGNITAPYFIGNVTGNISGNITVPGANTQVIYNNAGQANASAGFTFNSASNAMVVTGNVTGGNILTTGLISSTGNITGGNLLIPGTVLLGGTGGAQTLQVDPTASSINYLTVSGGLVSGGLQSQYPAISASGSATNVGILYAAKGTASHIFTSQSGAVQLVVVGTINSVNNLQIGGGTSGNSARITVSGTDSDAGIFIGTKGAGIITANAAISTTGNITSGNLLTGGYVSASGNILGGNLITGGVVSATGNLQSSGNLSVAGNAVIVGSLTVQGNVTFIGSNVITTNNLYIELANNQSTYAGINTAGLTVGPSGSPLTYWQYLNASNTWSTNVGISVSGNITSSNLSVGTGTITVGNIVNSNSNAVGNIGSSSNYFNTVFAQSTSALYADLAENYLADAQYAPGTVLSFGGEEELTISTQDNDSLIAGIVSTNPAYQMNSGLSGKFVVALTLSGRVPCLVQGAVTPGAMMVSAGNGRARAEVNPKMGTVIGKAITGFSGGKGVIEILVGRL